MDTYKLKFTSLQQKIFRALCIESEKEINQRELAELLKVSSTAISKSLIYLVKINLIHTKKTKLTKLISLNRDNENVIELKRIENLSQTYESGLINYLKENFPLCPVILFGSYSTGEDNSDSDVDIAIINSKPKKLELEKFEKILKRDIIINYYSSLKQIDANLKENLINGVRLTGHIEI
ncbi:MAG: nucleotidyltransferase domain-containing protein [Nanoarchaeota archaeon]|nr:nucleotidyltransferase domain-containing protein [Nanoarchaeota archaeon]